MARVILVRHGQTEWNRVERFRGHVDVPLNETGLQQAERAAEAIRGRYRVAAIYSSPLRRAMRTAEAIGRRTGVPVEPLSDIVDLSFGEWEGKPREEVKASYPELFRLYVAQPQHLRIPGGETVRQLRARTSAAVEKLAERHRDDTVVLVSHRMVCHTLVGYFLGLPISHLWRVLIDTASLSIFEKGRNGWVALLLNDTCHLR